ncbi:DMT family transporter [Deltaproteobacteria bacterium OttesenSCG-928-K17]|nr:DMT family transporter [Deltaproteobacteria bacterium OttesenSCG-928-K17]
MNLHLKSVLLLFATAALWSTAGVMIKSVDWSPQAIASLRSLVAGLAIMVMAGKDMRWTKPDRIELIGAVCLAVLSLAFVMATKMTTAANAIFIQYSAPVWVAVAAPLFLGERTSGRDWFFIILVLVGLSCFFKDSLSIENYKGNLAALVSSFCFAGVALTVRLAKDGGPLRLTVYGCLLLGISGLFFCRPPWPPPEQLGLVAVAGVLQFGLPYYLYALASRGVSSLELVLIPALEPVLNPLWVLLVVGEKPGLWAVIGGAIVLASITARSVLKVSGPRPGK